MTKANALITFLMGIICIAIAVQMYAPAVSRLLSVTMADSILL